ncbi:NAD(P)H-hydrate epimerase [Maribacter polysiphoniae]|uniref:NAD(P)H-hydrate epimerase n=1 Tax=Maribacter polysiphoniae TaxID=429344 RepID=A0A316DVC2_9FLAO|nr:NAD(P)H-hydrate epimerase [Maribacter polysiphoniae]MBD1262639.1 NAD(P)H-hydrate epimerase [Maribacter polysiphoniae]PWK21159.1 NAD(P)H-hydrate epimerase [Maribacter polysiphoniae]
MSTYIKNSHTDSPKINTAQMIEVDRLMMDEYHIGLIQMMENAGRCLAILVKERFFDGDVEGKNIVILAGTGGNGGGALVAARRLHNWGAKVQVYTTAEEERFTPIPLHQYRILKRMGVSISLAEPLPERENIDAVLDGIIGYSLKGNPHGIAAAMIHWANSQKVPIVALDTPSGLDLTTGEFYEPIIKASATLTLALPKKGLFACETKKVVGELYVGDISVPQELYQEKGLGLKPTNIFRYSDIIRLY